MSGIQYPVDIKDIGKFENQNNITVNVHGCEDKKIFPLRITTLTVARDHVNLLYITAGETSHYVLVKDLSRLVSRQYNNDKGKKYFCQYCLQGCTSEEALKNHLERCKLHGAQRIWRQEGAWQNQIYSSRIPTTFTFCHLREFESILRKQDLCEPSSSKSFTTQYQYHVTCRSCIYVKCSDGQYFEPHQVNMGDDAAETFWTRS